MLLALDIGNSSISVGVFDISNHEIQKNDLIYCFQLSARDMSSDEYALQIYNFLKIKNISPSRKSKYFCEFPESSEFSSNVLEITCAVIASVVPAMTTVLAKAVEYLIGNPPFIIGAGVKTGLGIRIKNPEQLGADIVANAVAAVAASRPPLIILDVGTATTLTVVDQNKDLLGAVIMPGLRVSLQALSGSAAQLSDVALSFPDALIGRDSAESVRSGVVRGHILMLDGFVRSIREYLAERGVTEKLSLLSTGGLSHLVIPHMRNKFTNYNSLTLYGAAKIFLMNCKNI